MDKEYLLTATIPDLQCTLERRRLPAERSYPTSEVRGSGQEELPMSKARGGAERSYLASKDRGSQEEPPCA